MLWGQARTPQRQGDLQHLPFPTHLGEASAGECGGDTSLLVPPWGGTAWGRLGAGAGDDAGSSLQGAGAGHQYWVQGTYTGCCCSLQGAGATLGIACETLGAGAEHWVLGARGGCWCRVLVLIAGAGCQFGDDGAG